MHRIFGGIIRKDIDRSSQTETTEFSAIDQGNIFFPKLFNNLLRLIL
jgi:hypothetical protein